LTGHLYLTDRLATTTTTNINKEETTINNGTKYHRVMMQDRRQVACPIHGDKWFIRVDGRIPMTDWHSAGR
jgi:hypothetical protein